jgi:hypothetical protein
VNLTRKTYRRKYCLVCETTRGFTSYHLDKRLREIKIFDE